MVQLFEAGCRYGTRYWDSGGGTPGRRLAAKPVTNLLISGNLIDRASGAPLEIHNVDGLFIQGNHIDRPSRSAKPDWLKLQDCACPFMINDQGQDLPPHG